MTIFNSHVQMFRAISVLKNVRET